MCRVLRSWISPFWFAGTLVAFTTTLSPAVTVDEDRDRVGVRDTAIKATPEMRSSKLAAAAMIAYRRLCDLFFATGWAGAGSATATVAPGFTARAPATRGATATPPPPAT